MNFGFIPSLFLYFGVLSLIYAAGLHYYLRDKDPEVVGHWSRGAFVWGLSVLTTIFRAELPQWLSYFIANGMAFVAYVEINRGLKVLSIPERSQRPLYSPRATLALMVFGSLLYAALLFAIHLGTPSPYRELAKTGYVSLLMVFVAVQGARYCFQIYKRHKIKVAYSFAWLFLIVAAQWSARIISAGAGHGAYAFDASLINSLIFVSIFVTGLIKYLIFPVLLLQKSEIDQQSQLRTTLIKANKTVTSGGLSASLAHELNQPLTAIRINGQILQKAMQGSGVLADADVKAMINDILSENERAAKIITSLRTIFMSAPAKWTNLDSSALINKALSLVTRELDDNRIQLKLSLSEGLQISVSEEEILQVLLNLLINSIDALKGQSENSEKIITIVASQLGDKVQIMISDNGPGMSKEIEAVLFEILSTTKDSGMGVGLWLSRYIVERHEGQLSYAPSQQGGAMFTISLPIAQYPTWTNT